MCVAYDARPATKDVDAVFAPSRQIREAAKKVAESYGLPEDWLNDAVKGFVVSHPRRILLDLPSLQVFIPEPDYLLAMKTLSARVDATDKTDVVFLIEKIGVKSPREVFEILAKYYPNEQIKPANAVLHRGVVPRMTTLKQTRDNMAKDSANALIHLMEFVDDFRRSKDLSALREPFVLSDERLDALAAATGEKLCMEAGLEPPEWLERVPACRNPWFVSGLESLKAIALVESPLPFRLRKIFVLGNFLARA
jgi:antitoxin component of RelBE/YafQ-DinJ toxin-antitoxin module